jgi:hypothetical protein
MPTNLSTFLGSSFAGSPGPQGSQGIRGPQGAQGSIGPQGSAAASDIPAGSVLLFYQASAPTGWTQVTTQNNKAMRVVSGTGGGTGGSTAFTSVFASRTPAGTVSVSNAAVTLTSTQIPSHSHGIEGTNGIMKSNPISGFLNNQGINQADSSTNPTGGGGSHTHANTATFSGTALDFAVQYILCSKN